MDEGRKLTIFSEACPRIRTTCHSTGEFSWTNTDGRKEKLLKEHDKNSNERPRRVDFVYDTAKYKDGQCANNDLQMKIIRRKSNIAEGAIGAIKWATRNMSAR